MRCHPESPYLAMACSDGSLQLVSILGGNPQILTEFCLCSEELSTVKFNKNGTLLITASYKKGRIFVVQVIIFFNRKCLLSGYFTSYIPHLQ